VHQPIPAPFAQLCPIPISSSIPTLIPILLVPSFHPHKLPPRIPHAPSPNTVAQNHIPPPNPKLIPIQTMQKKKTPNNKISSLCQSSSCHLGPFRNTPCSSARGIHEMLEPTVLNFGKRVWRRRQDFGVRHVNLKARCIVGVHVLVVGLQTAPSSASVSPPYT
jgi:hypothetical protein